MIHTTQTITFNRWVYNEEGETYGELYYVGDRIKAIWKTGGGTSGRITEIIVDEAKNIYQIKVHNGWCSHPNNGDLINVITPYNKKEVVG